MKNKDLKQSPVEDNKPPFGIKDKLGYMKEVLKVFLKKHFMTVNIGYMMVG